MDLDTEFRDLFRFLAAQIPEMAAMFLGMLLSLANAKRYPRPALLGFLGFALLLVVSIGSMIVVIYVPRHLPNLDSELFIVVAWGGRSVLFAVAYVLLISAIYAARKPRLPMPPFPPHRQDAVTNETQARG